VKKDEFYITYKLPVQKYKEFLHCKDTDVVRTNCANLQPIIFTKKYTI